MIKTLLRSKCGKESVKRLVGRSPLILEESEVTVLQVQVGGLADDVLTVDILADGAVAGDPVNWALFTATGGTVVAQSTGAQAIWPDTSIELPGTIPFDQYTISIAVRDSPFVSSGLFELDTIDPILSALIATPSADAIDCSVTTNKSGGTIHAALRDQASPQGSAADIIAGAGYLATDSIINPTQGADNAGQFSGLDNGAFAIDLVQVDGFGNISGVVSALASIESGAEIFFQDDFNYIPDTLLTTANPDYAVAVGSELIVRNGGLVEPTNGYDGVVHSTAMTGLNYGAEIDVDTSSNQMSIFLDYVDSANHYFLYMRASDGLFRIRRRLNGSLLWLTSGVNHSQVPGFTATFQREGDELVALKDGQEILRVTDTTFTNGAGGFAFAAPAQISRFTLKEV